MSEMSNFTEALEQSLNELSMSERASSSKKSSVNKEPTSLIVISNRLPFVLIRGPNGELSRKASAGGLVTAVAPVVIDRKGIWVGWTGLNDFDEARDSIPESLPTDMTPTAGLKSSQAMPVSVDEKLFDDYYNGCCNETFWPMFHSMPDRAVFNIDHWKSYIRVNDIFAEKTMEAVRKVNAVRMSTPLENRADAPIIWIHDYHLMLAANGIRDQCIEEGIDVRMGFFLHIPFPSFDIVRIFPWVNELLMGILGCDVVAFHIEDYCLNFLDCCQRCLGCRTNKDSLKVEHCGRTVTVKALPIGIPYQRFESLAKSAPRVFGSDTKVILGVDRLDYTKGLVARMRALRRLFQKYPKWIGKVTFIQVAVPSRTDVLEYKELKETIDRQVGEINGAFSTPAWSPIRYIFGSITQDQLSAFYRDAFVALITPLRDGMNLVAKEFVACQSDDDPGVLILSPFAGAGGLMQEALQVNPYEVDNVVDVLDRALEMGLDERQLRMNQLKRRERRMDVDAWVQGFLQGMDSLLSPLHDEHVEGLLSGNAGGANEFETNLGAFVETSTELGIILDFDGTLSFLARTPDLAFIPPETKKILERLSNMHDVHVCIISGRQLEDLKRKVGVEGITYAGCQGLEIVHPGGQKYKHTLSPEYEERLSALQADLEAEVKVHGAWVEHKKLLVAWHYREVDKDKQDELIEKALEVYHRHDFKTLTVSKRLENQPPEGYNRGDSCIHILRTLFGVDWEERVKVIYAGDSASDEYAISRLKGVARTFRVSNEDTRGIMRSQADYWIPGPDGVLSLLRFLERKLLGRSPRTVSRRSSEFSLTGLDTEPTELSIESDEETSVELGMRRRTSSHGASGMIGVRRGRPRTSSHGSLMKQTLNKQMHNRLSRDETNSADLPL